MNLTEIQRVLDNSRGQETTQFGIVSLFNAVQLLVNELAGPEIEHPDPSCSCLTEPDQPLLESVPQGIKIAVLLVETWMQKNGHTKWKLMGIQSRED